MDQKPTQIMSGTTVGRPLKQGNRFAFENFFVDETNRFAFSYLKALAEGSDGMSPIVIVLGDVGQGKSHLLRAVRQLWSKREFPKRAGEVRRVTAETFTNTFIKSVQDKGSKSIFEKFYRDVDCLLFDELPFLEGKIKTQEEFVNTIEAIISRGGTVVVATTVLPKNLKLRPDLISRLSGGVTLTIGKPNQETRLGVLKLFAKDQKEDGNWPEELLSDLACRLDGDLRQLQGTFLTAVAHCRLLKTKPGPQVLDLVCASRGDGPAEAGLISLETIEAAVSFQFRFLPGKNWLRSSSRRQPYCLARQLAMYLSRRLLPELSLVDIGDYFGGRDHSTVVVACKSVEKFLLGERGEEIKGHLAEACSRLGIKWPLERGGQ
ncbi:MAG: DnaA/Hda family protein [Candidatus Paceibacterota bacterium]|jgi:chromosomal replication initiator protein